MNIADLSQYCESPIEVALCLAMAGEFSDVEAAGMALAPLAPLDYERSAQPFADGGAFLVAQAIVTGADLEAEWTYRPDFLLVCSGGRMFRKVYAIECDGHEWHEKTKAQVARDKLRDRRFILDDIIPIRFSGSEIHRSPSKCAAYIRSLAHGAMGDVLGDQYSWEELKKLRQGTQTGSGGGSDA